MSDITKFYSLAHICISFIGGLLLLVIWYNIKKRFKNILEEDESKKRIDKGLLYLSLALFVWVFSGTWIFSSNQFGFADTIVYDIGYSLFSVMNNLFLLLALFYFDFAPSFLYKNKRNTILITILILAVAVITFVLLQLFKDSPVDSNLSWSGIPDLLLSSFITYLLIVSFYKTFMNRGLKLVAIISVLAIGLMLLSQIPDVILIIHDTLYRNLIKIVAKTSLIAVFLVLATSWVIQLALTPRASEMTIAFLDWGLVKITIPSKEIYDRTVDFGAKATQYKNLLRFAVRRKSDTIEKQYILVSSSGEIKSQTYLSRIIDNMNSILELKEESQLERKDLFTFVGQGKYRLRVIPQNIIIDKALSKEFDKTA